VAQQTTITITVKPCENPDSQFMRAINVKVMQQSEKAAIEEDGQGNGEEVAAGWSDRRAKIASNCVK